MKATWDDLPTVLIMKILRERTKLIREAAALVFQKYIRRTGPLFAYRYSKAVRGTTDGNKTLREVYLENIGFLQPLPLGSPASELRRNAHARRHTKAILKSIGY
eukprot:scaffold7085_cov120-Isochrysis_galbana.AAC.5